MNLVLTGRRCVVVGGGRIAARKIEALLDAGADVHVIAPDAERRGRGLGRRRPAHARRAGRSTPADLDGAWLATTATGDPAVDRAVFDGG